MNITFLIGNGFDIGIGMKSQFKQYFPIYQAQSLKKEKRIKALSENIGTSYDTWADFESRLGEYTKDFTADTKQDYLDQIRDFETGFVAYLKTQEENLSFDNSETIAQSMGKALLNFAQSDVLTSGSSALVNPLVASTSRDHNRYNFISFNYTFVLDKCLSTIKNGLIRKKENGYQDIIGEIIHVHGTYDNAPFMGVNDRDQIANEELRKDARFSRVIVKPELNKAHRTNQDINAFKLIENSGIICIYGMSLGKTDRLWWNKIIRWLNVNNARHLVVFIYDANFDPSSQFDFIDQEDALIDILKDYAATDKIDVESLRPRIHLAMNKNIFEIKLENKYARIMEKTIERVRENGFVEAMTT